MAKRVKNKIILEDRQLEFILNRLVLEIIENHSPIDHIILLGVQPRGVELCNMIHKLLEARSGKKILQGTIDNTLHRDDIHIKASELNRTHIPVSLEGKDVILVDDVLYTGRTIRATLDSLMDFGRPNDVELLVLIDRRLHRNVPIQAKYVGMSIDSIESEKVKVYLNKENEKNRVEIIV